jgi:hypothetical protein
MTGDPSFNRIDSGRKSHSGLWILPFVAFVCVIYYTLLLGAIFSEHWSNAFALEMNESICLDLADRVAHGDPLFSKPSADYISSCYPPFYFQLTGALLRFTGPSLPALRLVSIGSLVLLCLITGIAMGKCSYSGVAIALTIGLFLAAYEKAGDWYELARVDMLYVLLLGGAFWCILLARKKIGLLVGIALVCLSIRTKHTTVFFLPVLALLVRSRFGNWWAVGATAAPILAFTVELLLDEWAWFYLIKLPRQQRLVPSQINQFVGWALPTVLVTGVVQIMRCMCNVKAGIPEESRHVVKSDSAHVQSVREWFSITAVPEFHVWAFYVCALAGGILASLKVGGSLNHFIPLFYFNALVAGVAWDSCGKPRVWIGKTWLVRGLILIQFIVCFYTWEFSKSQTERANLDYGLLNELRALKRSARPVYCHELRANHVVLLAGFRPLFNYQSLEDLRLAKEHERVADVLQELRMRISRNEIGYILVAENAVGDELFGLGTNYVRLARVPETSFGPIIILGTQEAASVKAQ